MMASLISTNSAILLALTNENELVERMITIGYMSRRVEITADVILNRTKTAAAAAAVVVVVVVEHCARGQSGATKPTAA